MEFAETGHRQEEHSDPPVKLLMVLHTLRLECEKLMELTVSSHYRLMNTVTVIFNATVSRHG